jgi:integrase
MKKPKPHGLRRYDKERKIATFEYIVPGTHGRKRVQQSYNVSGWTDVSEKSAQFRSEMRKRFGVTKEIPTFAEFIESEWETSLKRRTSERRQITNWSLLNLHLVPHFGRLRLNEIADAHVEEFVYLMKDKQREESRGQRGYSPGYVNSGLSLLRCILRHAKRRGVIHEYPLRESLPLLPEPKLRNELTDEEETRFLNAFDDGEAFRRYIGGRSGAGKLLTSPHFGKARRFGGGMRSDSDSATYYFNRFCESKPLFLAALHTGLRKDDLRHLRWSEVNLRSGVVTVVMRKTKETVMVPISSQFRQMLLRLRRKPLVGEHVFLTSAGQPYSVTTINRYFSIAKILAGITRRVRFHDLRHTFGSKLASHGISTGIIRRCLGHTSARMAERYAFPSDEAVRGVRWALEEAPAGRSKRREGDFD